MQANTNIQMMQNNHNQSRYKEINKIEKNKTNELIYHKSLVHFIFEGIDMHSVETSTWKERL